MWSLSAEQVYLPGTNTVWRQRGWAPFHAGDYRWLLLPLGASGDDTYRVDSRCLSGENRQRRGAVLAPLPV